MQAKDICKYCKFTELSFYCWLTVLFAIGFLIASVISVPISANSNGFGVNFYSYTKNSISNFNVVLAVGGILYAVFSSYLDYKAMYDLRSLTKKREKEKDEDAQIPNDHNNDNIPDNHNSQNEYSDDWDEEIINKKAILRSLWFLVVWLQIALFFFGSDFGYVALSDYRTPNDTIAINKSTGYQGVAAVELAILVILIVINIIFNALKSTSKSTKELIRTTNIQYYTVFILGTFLFAWDFVLFTFEIVLPLSDSATCTNGIIGGNIIPRVVLRLTKSLSTMAYVIGTSHFLRRTSTDRRCWGYDCCCAWYNRGRFFIVVKIFLNFMFQAINISIILKYGTDGLGG